MTDTPRPTRFAGESWRTASAMHARVVGAVIMRDLQTRFGTGYFGFLLGLIIPLGHLTIAIGVNLLIGRAVPLGTDTLTFLMTGVLPFVLWLYAHRQIMMTVPQNRPLLYFPGVDVFDLFAARIIIEIVNCTLVALIVFATLITLGHQLEVANWPGFLQGLIFAWIFGLASGLVFGGLGILSSAALIAGNILGPLLWAISGLFFLPDILPEKLRDAMAYNPMAQIIESVRVAYYSEYASSFLDLKLLNTFLVACLLGGMALVVLTRRIV